VIEDEIARRLHNDLKWYFVLSSVARRRLAENENPSARATVDCKMCESAIAPYLW
jgi:hypothetical protein